VASSRLLRLVFFVGCCSAFALTLTLTLLALALVNVDAIVVVVVVAAAASARTQRNNSRQVFDSNHTTGKGSIIMVPPSLREVTSTWTDRIRVSSLAKSE
jgi:hypothetical protein